MSDKENNKAPNRENKRNEAGRPEGKLNSKHLPPKFENHKGEPMV